MRFISVVAFISLILCCQSVTLTVNQIYQCSCGNISAQAQCTGTYCSWDSSSSTCQNKPCSSFLIKDDCQGVPDPFNCVWNYATDSCATFTKCADYTYNVSDADYCYDLIKCQVNLNSYDSTNAKIGCMDRTSDSIRSIASCDTVAYEDCYWLTTPDGKQCQKNSTTQKCEAQTITSCADYSTQDNCNTYACYWDGTKCQTITCSIIPQKACYIYFSYDLKSASFCQWNSVTSKCADLDPTTLAQGDCLGSTLYSYIWNPDTSKCELCQPVDSTSRALIKTIGIMSILISLLL